MKAMIISFAAGLLVGVIYAFLRVKSPAPPLVALTGLLGIVWGEQIVERFLAQKAADAQISSTRSVASSPARNAR